MRKAAGYDEDAAAQPETLSRMLVLHHGARGDFLGPLPITPRALRGFLDVLILALLFGRGAPKMFSTWHTPGLSSRGRRRASGLCLKEKPAFRLRISFFLRFIPKSGLAYSRCFAMVSRCAEYRQGCAAPVLRFFNSETIK